MADRLFSKLLIANRGEIARRIQSAARAMGIGTVAVFADPDEWAPFVAEADEAVRLPGTRSVDTYLDVEQIVAAARRTGADALHPGYGFLAESPELAGACEAAGITFVGPPVAAMRAMAHKLEAKELVAGLGVPVLETIRVPALGAGGATGAGDDLDAVAAQAEAIGYPILVKASAGGGGTGIHLVERADELPHALETAQREAAAAFGDGTVFLERYLAAPHHVEIQILADTQGKVLHLFERECSIQRRHQKLVEEAPSPNVDDRLRSAMAEAAVAIAKAVGYVGVGTVELLVEGDRFFFLEMNTRLQVEHRVTEAVTGVDLVRAQLEVAAGHPLALAQEDLRIDGHAIEVRLYAEDPAHGFLPVTGTLHCYEHAAGEGVSFDDAVVTGSVVTPHFDALLSKVFSHAPRRREAAARLAHALRAMHVHGIRSNRDFLAALLDEPDFLAGRVDTGYVERHPELRLPSLPAAVEDAHVVAAAFATDQIAHATSPVAFAPMGWRNVAGPPRRRTFERPPVDGMSEAVEVSLQAVPGNSFRAEVDDRHYNATVIAARAGLVDVELDGLRRRCVVHFHGEGCYVSSPAGNSELRLRSPLAEAEVPEAEGSATAPVPGNVVRLAVEVGQRVSSGDLLAVLEAMKMEHRLTAPSDGVVTEVRVVEGDAVDAHQVLVVVETG